ncbi:MULTISPECIES: TetR/AcrR family transcriptional regulator [Rhodococcus]|nr:MULTISPECIES: TetR/AcrR family transcriptional regulator [Rhodococcus]MDV7241742.1 TetR/AcrR family transcriptional regulator [Rhodococcus oxybenzonivorans]MDV7273724.1 TetR/AcrR family transcriptional regulator [Rhodococcus oxybenzonivorans]MDV7334024.1 TetR/AcrR family transcriptional regulator [Rhodococcus oxybenzonivorans]MDV7343443.1 TetR/AcrR family transcriptional regulator [Rhodococcus oxybenzonivorans]MDV8027778.1 TetR/AcrR family transcriptional regulator [Rhodococcus sp. IEGM 27]
MSSPRLEEPGRTYRGAGPQQRQEERRLRLIDAAVEVFGTTGYRSATVGKICAVAGLTKRYFYESFTDSEALLLAAYGTVTDRLREDVLAGAGRDAADLDTRVRGALTAFFESVAEDPRISRIAFQEVLGVGPEVDRAYRRVTLEFVDAVLFVINPAIDRAPDPHLHTLATGLVGAVLMIAQQWVLSEKPQPIEAVIADAHTILSSVLGRLTD